jgi:hypothetical protein
MKNHAHFLMLMCIYLKLPLIEELEVLRKGVEMFDAYLGVKFNLKAMCMWNHYNKKCPCMPSDFIRF